MTTKAPRKATTFSPTTGDGLYLPNRWRWTVDEFQRAYDLGVFGFDAKLELIEGEIIEKMSQKGPHSWAIRATEETLRRVFVAGHDVRVQLPLVFTPHNKPEPDVAVVAGSFNDYKINQPTTAVLVVEVSDSTLQVSDSTLQVDQTTKAAVYAREGILEYWIVNIRGRLLEVYREPAAMPGQPLGHHYRSITRLGETDAVAPLAAPEATVSVADLLP